MHPDLRQGLRNPPGFEDHQVCSDPFRKSSILTDSSRASQICVLTRSDWIRRFMSIELSRFYHGNIYRRYPFSAFRVSGGQSSGGAFSRGFAK